MSDDKTPVKCKDCAHWSGGPPMNCAKVPADLRYRATVLVNKHWLAEEDGCEDFESRAEVAPLWYGGRPLVSVRLGSINRVLGWFGLTLVTQHWDGDGEWTPTRLVLVWGADR